MRIGFLLHITFWSALLAVFVARSIPTVGPAVLENKIGPIDPNYSTDVYLRGLTHVRDGTRLFSDLINILPRDKSLVIVVNAGNSPSEFLGMLVAYLSLPLDVRIIEVRPETMEREIMTARSASVAAFFFCSVKPPPSLTNGSRFGSEIIFVPNTALGSNQ